MESLLNDPVLVSYISGGAAFFVVVLLWSAFMDRDPLTDRLRNIAEHRDELQLALLKKVSRRVPMQNTHLMKQVVNWFKLTQGKSVSEIRLKLLRAGYRSRDVVIKYLFIKLVLLGGALFIGILLVYGAHAIKGPAAMGMMVVLGSGMLGWYLPDILIKNQTQKREDILRKAMPDALDLMVICAEAGLSLDASFARVGHEVGQSVPELASELELTSVELSFLPDRHQALRGLADRVPLPSMLALVNTLIQTEKYGTPLAQALRVLSSEMRNERIMKAEEKAARLPAILTVPMIVFILPPLFVVLIGPAALKVMAIMAGH